MEPRRESWSVAIPDESPHIRHLVRHNQMVLGIDRNLHVVPDDAGTAPTRRHRAGVRIGERDLLVGRGEHLFLDRREALHLNFEFREFFLEPRRLERERLRRLLPIRRVELAEIPRTPPSHRAA
jgi:hypothetical protein